MGKGATALAVTTAVSVVASTQIVPQFMGKGDVIHSTINLHHMKWVLNKKPNRSKLRSI